MKGRADVLGRVMRNTFWDAYDHLGTLVLVNVLWLLACLPVVTIPLATAGMLRVTYEMAVSRDAGLGDFFKGAARFWLPATVLTLVLVVLLCLAAGNVAFYVSLAQAWPFVGVALAALCMWLLFGCLAAGPFVVAAAVELWTAEDEHHLERAAWLPEPPVVHHERLGLPNVSRGVRSALRIGLVLFLQAPVIAGAMLLNLAGFWILCVVSCVGVVLCAAGVTCLACHHAYGETVAELTGLGDRRRNEGRSLRELLPPYDAGPHRR